MLVRVRNSRQAGQFSDEPRRTDFRLKLSATVFNARLCSGDLVGARRFPGSATDCITRSGSIKNCGMSALPPKADIRSAKSNVRYGPIADSCSAAKGIAIGSPYRHDRLDYSGS